MNNGIRFAETPAEYHAAYRLRYKTYVQSMGRFKDNCDHERQELRDKYDEKARIVIAVKNNKVIGTLRVLWGNDLTFDHHLRESYRITPFLNTVDPKKICIVERLMVDENHRGSATMLRMFNVVMHFIFAQQIELLLMTSDTRSCNSYIKLGCKPFTRQVIHHGIGPVIPMALVVGNYQHLKQIGSPFSLLATADDLSYCQHTSQLINTIQRETAIAMMIAPKQIHVTIPSLSAANHSIYSKIPQRFNHRLRQRLTSA